MQQLTERQCWKLIRNLVSSKNDEYASFLYQIFDKEQMKKLQGHTRDTFLARFGIYSSSQNSTISALNDYIREKGREPVSRWLENLSSEDLLLFLDFRCNILQKLYDRYRQNEPINIGDVRQIVESTPISPIAKGTYRSLICSGKPARVKGEVKLADLPLSEPIQNNIALAQVMGKLAYRYSKYQNCSIDKAIELVNGLTTSNITHKGYLTGHRFETKVILPQEDIEVGQKLKYEERPKLDQSKRIHVVGYRENLEPIFMRGEHFVNILGEIIPPVDIVYDIHKNKILHKEDELQELDSLFDPQNGKLVGFDIQGSPVYEDEYGYYSAIGERLDDDIYIEKDDDLRV